MLRTNAQSRESLMCEIVCMFANFGRAREPSNHTHVLTKNSCIYDLQISHYVHAAATIKLPNYTTLTHATGP